MLKGSSSEQKVISSLYDIIDNIFYFTLNNNYPLSHFYLRDEIWALVSLSGVGTIILKFISSTS
jgi:hypothetical protein